MWKEGDSLNSIENHMVVPEASDPCNREDDNRPEVPDFSDWVGGLDSREKQVLVIEFFLWRSWQKISEDAPPNDSVMFATDKIPLYRVIDNIDYFGDVSEEGITSPDFEEYMNKAYREEFNLAF